MIRGRNFWRDFAFWTNAVLVVAIPLVVAWMSYPSSEAARLRNSLLIAASVPATFDWTPASVPPDFKQETRNAGPEFDRIVEAAGIANIQGDFERARALAAMLTRHMRDMGAIQRDLWTTYRRIVDFGEGYCVDYTTTFMALAHAAGLPVRQWSFSFDGFGGRGHTFDEIWDAKRGKWVFLDVYNNFYALDPVSGQPMSALEFRDSILGKRAAADLIPLGPGRPGFEYPEKARAYYRNGADGWYMWWGNNVIEQDQHPLLRSLLPVSRAASQLSAILLDVYPGIRVLATSGNAAQIVRMRNLGVALVVLFFVWLTLVVALILQLWTRGRGDAGGAARASRGYGDMSARTRPAGSLRE